MISTTNEPITTCLIEVERESIITMVPTFGSFHENEIQRKIRRFMRGQFYPIHTTLIMGNINTMHIIAERHTDTISFPSLTRFPAISIRTNKKPIKESGKYNYDTD